MPFCFYGISCKTTTKSPTRTKALKTTTETHYKPQQKHSKQFYVVYKTNALVLFLISKMYCPLIFHQEAPGACHSHRSSTLFLGHLREREGQGVMGGLRGGGVMGQPIMTFFPRVFFLAKPADHQLAWFAQRSLAFKTTSV